MPNEKPVILFLNKMADLLLLNLLFLICSVPIITMGPALTAMYHVNLRSIRYGDGNVCSEFFRSFKRNFIPSLIIWAGVLALGALLFVDFLFWNNLRVKLGPVAAVMQVICLCIVFLLFVVILWLFPVMAKMDQKLKQQIKTAAAMAVGHFFPYTFFLGAGTVLVFYFMYTSLVTDVLMLLIGCSLLNYILSFFFYKEFSRYIQEEPVGEDDPLYHNLT